MANTQTVTETKSEAKAEKKATKEKKSFAALVPAKNASFPEVGKQIFEGIAAVNKATDKKMKAEAELNTADGKLNALTAFTVHEIAKNDPNFNPALIFDKGRSDEIHKRLKLALGILTIQKDGSGNEKLVPAKGMEKYFPRGNKESATYITAKSMQSNLSMRLKRACEQVTGMLDEGAIPSINQHGFLEVKNAPRQIAGPDTTQPVVLDGKKKDGGDVRATVTAFGKMAKDRHSTSAATDGKPNGAEQKAAAALKSSDAFAEMCNGLIVAINKLEGNMTDAQKKHLAKVQEAIAKVL